MKFQLLCLTMPTRAEYLHRLTLSLDLQLSRRPDVALLIRTCDPTLTLGVNREILRRESTAEYIAFMDDDDLPASDYIDTILPLLDGSDYVGFDLQCYIDGKPIDRVTKHSLAYGGWYETDECYARDISHVNPIRRDLALVEPMEGGHGEDKRWADRMRARGIVKTENYIPRVMYHYFFRSEKHYTETCPQCGSKSVVKLEQMSFCNGCAFQFNPVPEARKSCLWP